MQEIEIYTTPILDGIKVLEYKGLVASRSVRAMNVLRDILTAFRDLFGGRSESYERIINEMHDEVLEEIKTLARQKGANAIIGFVMDLDSISAKSTSLLMAYAKGTAVVLDRKR